ncbi:hypothetical protein [Nocardioides sp. T2.26MG-1]|uniref:hypothetical protein n=1 Tax=Nocardioides sp. T2.26MG-1 TaxID=3041166 RepID=UPI002477A061|nr:hypothetical protein [Nocardioides sp. T2.26MG-1]CAI9407754.1 hypothetical protein HIDPHFAB_04847 [Nocardioides sp. T2.26MG-1]
MSDLLTYRVEYPDGSIRALCGVDCAETYVAVTGTPGRLLKSNPRRIKTSCMACASCGELVAKPPTGGCVMHPDGDCPDFHPLATIRALAAVQMLQERSRRFLPARGFEDLERTAEGLWAIGLEGTAERLAGKVWDLKAGWL